MKANLYTIKPISNLHVGSGVVNLGVVDNLVQRDVLTGLPNINASSLKGALREYFTHSAGEDKEKKKVINKIFGSPVKGEERFPGSSRFFDANLLAIPVRSDKVPFFLATCPSVVRNLIDTVKLFEIKLDGLGLLDKLAKEKPLSVFNLNQVGAFVEDLDKQTVLSTLNILKLPPLFGDAPLLLLSNEQFSTLCNDYHLPVIARNHLENGKSKNLFYEQVVPRFSVFYFVVIEEGNSCFSVDGELIQIGANASIGYGFCKFARIASKS